MVGTDRTVRVGEPGFDPYAVPSSYEECFEAYMGYVQGLVRKMGVPDDESEDVSHDVLLKFKEKSFLERFDPEYVVEHDGKRAKVKFQRFMSVFVERYTLGLREKVSTRRRREVLLMDMPIRDDEEGRTWGDAFAPPVDADHVDVEEWEYVETARRHLGTVAVVGRRDLGRVFDLMVDQVRRTGKEDRRAVGEALGVSQGVVGEMVRAVRQELRGARECASCGRPHRVAGELCLACRHGQECASCGGQYQSVSGRSRCLSCQARERRRVRAS